MCVKCDIGVLLHRGFILFSRNVSSLYSVTPFGGSFYVELRGQAITRFCTFYYFVGTIVATWVSTLVVLTCVFGSIYFVEIVGGVNMNFGPMDITIFTIYSGLVCLVL